MKFNGVSYIKRYNKWASYIYVDKKTIRIGYFSSELLAANTYNEYI